MKCTSLTWVIANSFFTPMEKFPEFPTGSYGLGWFINNYRGQKLVHHGGNIDGFSAMVAFIPEEKCGVVVLTNLDGTPLRDIIMFNVFDRLLGQKQIPWSQRMKKEYKIRDNAVKQGKENSQAKRVRGARPSHKINAYVGDYEHPGYGTLTILKTDNNLKASYNGLEMKLKHYHYDVFDAYSEELDTGFKLNFFSDVQGNISSLSAPMGTQRERHHFHAKIRRQVVRCTIP